MTLCKHSVILVTALMKVLDDISFWYSREFKLGLKPYFHTVFKVLQAIILTIICVCSSLYGFGRSKLVAEGGSWADMQGSQQTVSHTCVLFDQLC